MTFFVQGDTGGLNEFEKRIVKYLLIQKWINQDVLALINVGRNATVNPARIAEVKKDTSQNSATEVEFKQYENFKRSFDLKTGLNPYLDERLIKSREAMKLAVSSFNNPTLQFRAENFSMLAVVAWTYLILEHSFRMGFPTERKNGKAISLSDFLNSGVCDFSDGIKNNLKALVKIRDAAEHTVLGPNEEGWLGIFQASCINYEKTLVRMFGDRTSLAGEISFALQFSGLEIGQARQMIQAELPSQISSINAEIFDGLSDAEKENLEFQFSVVYTTVASSKSKSTFQFISPESAEGREIANVLVKHKPASETHPFRPSDVVGHVRERTGKKFNEHMHTQSWKRHQVRPDGSSENQTLTKIEYCVYNNTFGCHTYSPAWVDLLVSELNQKT